jgi:hypothetical protein
MVATGVGGAAAGALSFGGEVKQVIKSLCDQDLGDETLCGALVGALSEVIMDRAKAAALVQSSVQNIQIMAEGIADDVGNVGGAIAVENAITLRLTQLGNLLGKMVEDYVYKIAFDSELVRLLELDENYDESDEGLAAAHAAGEAFSARSDWDDKFRALAGELEDAARSFVEQLFGENGDNVGDGDLDAINDIRKEQTGEWGFEPIVVGDLDDNDEARDTLFGKVLRDINIVNLANWEEVWNTLNETRGMLDDADLYIVDSSERGLMESAIERLEGYMWSLLPTVNRIWVSDNRNSLIVEATEGRGHNWQRASVYVSLEGEVSCGQSDMKITMFGGSGGRGVFDLRGINIPEDWGKINVAVCYFGISVAKRVVELPVVKQAVAPQTPPPSVSLVVTEVAPPEDSGNVPEEITKNGGDETVVDDEVVPAVDEEEWAIANLLLTIATGITSLVILFGAATAQNNDKRIALRIISILPLVGAILAFVLIESMGAPMILVNWWSLLFLGLFVMNLGIASALALPKK